MEESFYVKRRTIKENVGGKFTRTSQSKNIWERKEVVGVNAKNKPTNVRKLSYEEVQEQNDKSLCVKCGEKWGKKHCCKASQAFMLVGPRDDNIKGELHDVVVHWLAKLEKSEEEAKLSLNAISKASKLSIM